MADPVERLRKWCKERGNEIYLSGVGQQTGLREAMVVALQETLDFKYTDNGIRALILELKK